MATFENSVDSASAVFSKMDKSTFSRTMVKWLVIICL